WTSLVATYPQGVCDYSKPGMYRRPTVPWQSYQDKAGNVVYGGRGLGAAPRSKPVAAPRCIAKRSLTFRFKRGRGGGRVVRVAVFVNGKRRLVRRGRNVRRVTLGRLPRGTFTVRIVTTLSNGARGTSTRT